MAKKKVDIKDLIDFKELQKQAKPEIYKYAMEVYKDIEKFSFKTITDFYKDYRPEYYHRLGQMPRIWVHPKIYEYKEGYKLEFCYSAQGLSMKHKEPHNYYIFKGPFEQGYHGGPRGRNEYTGEWNPAPQMFPSPWERIYEYARMKYHAYELTE